MRLSRLNPTLVASIFMLTVVMTSRADELTQPQSRTDGSWPQHRAMSI
jgi:hypothetical protein